MSYYSFGLLTVTMLGFWSQDKVVKMYVSTHTYTSTYVKIVYTSICYQRSGIPQRENIGVSGGRIW